MPNRTFDVVIHREVDPEGYWAEVPELPGCLAIGTTYDELIAAIQEAIGLILEDDKHPASLLTHVIGLRIETEQDLRPTQAHAATHTASQRKRQAHRDWPSTWPSPPDQHHR